MFYEMLTGAVPFSGENATAVMNQHLTVAAGLPSKINPAIPPNIDAIIMKSIQKRSKGAVSNRRVLFR